MEANEKRDEAATDAGHGDIWAFSGPSAAKFSSHASLTTCGASQRLAAERGASGVELWRRKDQGGGRGEEWVNTWSLQVASPPS